MKISQLYGESGPLHGRDVFIVGTGPSLACWRPEEFAGETCVLLNTAQRYVPWGPVAFSNHRRFLDGCDLPYQIVKGRLVEASRKKTPDRITTDNHCRWDDPKYYVFSYRSPWLWDAWDHFDDKALWREPDFYWNVKGGSVSIFAMQFAALAGAKSITMLGTDCSELIRKYHPRMDRDRGAKQVKHNYRAYWAGAMRMKREIWQRFGIRVGFETPWIGYGDERIKYQELVEWLSQSA